MAVKPLMTAAEFAHSGPDTDGFELVRGELIPMPPPKVKQGKVCGNAVFILNLCQENRQRLCLQQ